MTQIIPFRMKGKFIVLEGVDGSGKTTLAHSISDALGGAYLTFEPTKSILGSMLRSGEFGDIPASAEALLFVADRAIHTAEIEKILESGISVVCDRYIGSTVAYQAASMGDKADIGWLLSIQKSAVIEPDLTILLDVGPSQSMSRVDSRGEEKSRFEKLEFQKKVRQTYLDISERLNYVVIDASKSKEEVEKTVLKILQEKGFIASVR